MTEHDESVVKRVRISSGAPLCDFARRRCRSARKRRIRPPLAARGTCCLSPRHTARVYSRSVGFARSQVERSWTGWRFDTRGSGAAVRGRRLAGTDAVTPSQSEMDALSAWLRQNRFRIDTAPDVAPNSVRVDTPAACAPSGMVNVSIQPVPRHWRTGRQGRPRSFPFADEEVLSCAISAMRKQWRARCAML